MIAFSRDIATRDCGDGGCVGSGFTKAYHREHVGKISEPAESQRPRGNISA